MSETFKYPSLRSVKQAATAIGVTEQYARQLTRDGILAGQRVGRQWVVSENSLAEYQGSNSARRGNPPDQKRKSKKIPKLKALSFFSGAMGLDIGLEKAGIQTLLTCENDRACRQTILANKPEIGLIGDIWKYNAADIREYAALGAGEDIDLIVGGPPCQAFSTAGARNGFNDSRGNALLRYVELILELQPRYAVIENVRGLLSAPLTHRPHSERTEGKSLSRDERPGGALLLVIDRLRAGGYGVSFNLYNAANFGAPQSRERVIIICHRGGDKVPYLLPTHSDNSSHGLPKWRTVREVISSLPDQQSHLNFPEKRLRFYRLLEQGQYWKHLPTAEMQKEALGNSYYAGGGKTGFFRRLAWDRPSPTLVTNPTMPATDLAHPVADRPLSVEEYKRIQEFPDDWKICGSLLDQYRQVGNAVPISLGYSLGRHLLRHANNKPVVSLAGFNYSRYKNTDDVSWQKLILSTTSNKSASRKASINQLSLF